MKVRILPLDALCSKVILPFYSAVANIGNRRHPEKWSNELRHFLNFCELLFDLLVQSKPTLQACNTAGQSYCL